MAVTLRTVADLKRALVPDAKVDIENLRYPHLSGRRTVLKAQTKSWCLTFPPGHPKEGDPSGTWLNIPKRAEVEFDGATATLIEPDSGKPWLRITIP